MIDPNIQIQKSSHAAKNQHTTVLEGAEELVSMDFTLHSSMFLSSAYVSMIKTS